MINARPNLNGNTSEHFTEAARSLYAAINSARLAMSNIRSDVVHGRNYLTAGAGGHAADLLRLERHYEQLNDLEKLAADIYDAGRA